MPLSNDEPVRSDELLGRWVHSYEEDHDGVSVFRRQDFPFPPARGRRGVEFGADGAFVEWAIGRGDASEARPGRWEPADDGGAIARAGSGATLRVVRVRRDRLEAVAGSGP